MDDLVRLGKVRYIACSNYEAWRLSAALSISEREGLAKFVCYQPQYSLVVRDVEQELVPLCEYHGLGIVVWSPLAGGFLTGKYRPGERVSKGTRSDESWAYPAPYFALNADEILAALLEESSRIGRSPAEIALRWTIEQPGITSAIFGARDLEHLEANLRASERELPPELAQRLEKISRPRLLYPRSMEEGMVERRRAGVKLPEARP
jgi:aryl-alcohol dehydrogenase-like predicted oxidoreductase